MSKDSLLKRYAEAKQDHVFKHYDQLTAEQQATLISQLSVINPHSINNIYTQAIKQEDKKIEPLDCCESADALNTAELSSIGMRNISKLAVLLLAGGQGTRLGSSAPKGCYDINLPSHKSLFEIQADRMNKLGIKYWYVMTSDATRKETEEYFKARGNFGMRVKFFDQGVMPALTKDGKIILEDTYKLSLAPDGNGGMYKALKESGVLKDMKQEGIEYIHTYCVDNCLVRVGDPVFVGYCIQKGVKCGVKVVKKVLAEEQVGVVCLVNGKYGVVEYSEISEEDCKKKDAKGDLLLNAANIANHFYTLSCLEEFCSAELKYHVAHKKIKCVEDKAPTKPNGIKLELFIFDIFPLLNRKEFCVLSVARESEFSPLKNKEGVDSSETSRRDLYKQSERWLKEAGCVVEAEEKAIETILGEKVVKLEISPRVSYDGEGLAEVVKGKKLNLKDALYVDTLEQLKSLLQ